MIVVKVTMKELKVGDVILPINYKVYDNQRFKIYRVVEICANNTLLAEIYWYTERTFSKIPGITEFTDTEMYITNLELKFVKKELDFNLYKKELLKKEKIMQKKVVELLKQWRLEVEDAEIALGLCEETEEEKAERKAKDDSERGRDSGWLEACEIFVQNLEKILLEDIVEKNS